MINNRGTEVVVGRLYRFVGQTTLAHWYLDKIDGTKCYMRSKRGKRFVGNVNDLVGRGRKSLPLLNIKPGRY